MATIRLLSFFAVIAFLLLGCKEATAVLDLNLFPKDVSENLGAHCLDGTPSGYYFEPYNTTGSPESKNKWSIFLGSGGFCTIVDCPNRLKTDKGSSSNWPAQLLVGVETFISPNPLRNLDMWDWNHVYIPYCSGDYWAGQIKEASEQTGGLYFSGHNTIRAAIASLIQNHGLGDATDIIFSGVSSGGFGVFLNADYIAETLPKARVAGVPQGGFFLQTMTYAQWSEASDMTSKVSVAAQPTLRMPEFTCAANNRSYLFELYNAYVDESCAKAVPLGDVSLCMDPGFAYQYVKTPMFVVEDLYDSDQLFKVGLAPPPPSPIHPPFAPNLNGYVNYFGNCMLQSVQGIVKTSPNNGLFVPACLGHVIKNDFALNTPLVNGKNMMQALSQWMKNGYKDATFLEATVGQYNPTCPDPDDVPSSPSTAHNGFQNEDAKVMSTSSAPASAPSPVKAATPAKAPKRSPKKSPKQKRSTANPKKSRSKKARTPKK